MDWLKKIFGTAVPPIADVAVPDFATATVDELTAYNQALDNQVREIQARRALVAAHIETKLKGV